MDRSHFIQLLFAAIMGAIAKEVVSWLISFSKISLLTQARKEKVGALFSKDNRRIVFDLCLVAMCAVLLTHTLRDTAPLTRWTVLKMVAQTNAVCFWIVATMWDIITRRISRT